MPTDTRSYRPAYNPNFLRSRGIKTNAGKGKATKRIAVKAPKIEMPEPTATPVELDNPHHVVKINGMAISLPKISIQHEGNGG